MSIFQDIKNGRFYLGDCLEVMKEIPDGSVDIVLCDLPVLAEDVGLEPTCPFGQEFSKLSWLPFHQSSNRGDHSGNRTPHSRIWSPTRQPWNISGHVRCRLSGCQQTLPLLGSLTSNLPAYQNTGYILT